MDLNLHYEGLTTPASCAQCGHLNPTYVQGASGPERRDARQGEGLALIRVFPWAESAHDVLRGMSRVPSQVLTAREQLAMALYQHTLEALEDDGKIDAQEGTRLAQDLVDHAELPATIKAAVSLVVGLVKK